MITCTKLYDSIPFAHRQHLHDGHCAYIHGHNWGISITFGCKNTDENDFVVDFGKLKFIKEWIVENLDHACVLAESDPLREEIYNSVACAYKPYVVESCSCEGLAKHLFDIFDKMVREYSNDRAFVAQISISEDEKNTACYSKD
ncbi:MAG: 6-carboxytetrahydropterin synthase [Opitutales bacterium]